MERPLVPPSLRKWLTKTQFENLKFKFCSLMRKGQCFHNVYRNNIHGLQKEFVERRAPGKHSSFFHYYIDGDPVRYVDTEEYYAAYVRYFEAENKRRAMRCAKLADVNVQD